MITYILNYITLRLNIKKLLQFEYPLSILTKYGNFDTDIWRYIEIVNDALPQKKKKCENINKQENVILTGYIKSSSNRGKIP